MIQYLIVGLIVLLAALQVARKYMPASWRRKLVYLLSGRKAGAQSKVVKWLDTDASCGSGCDTCKACETDAQPPADSKQRVIKLRVER